MKRVKKELADPITRTYIQLQVTGFLAPGSMFETLLPLTGAAAGVLPVGKMQETFVPADVTRKGSSALREKHI